MPALISIILATLSLLTFAIGVAEVALESAVLRNFDKYAARTSTVWPEHHREGLYQSLFLVPANLSTQATDAIFVCGAMAIVFGIVSLVHMAFTWTRDVEQVKTRPEKLTVASVITGIASTATTFALLIYTFVKEYTSSEFHYTDSESSGSYFTRESWACQMKVLYRSKDFWVWTCSDAKAARWILVPLLICLAALTTATFLTFQLRPSAAIELTTRSKRADQEGSA